jgi:hypothetical protein
MKALSFLKYIPDIVSAVRAAEEIIPGVGQGQTKLNLVLGLIQDAVEDYNSIAGVVTKWVGRIVTALNASGEFKK